jgi:hypothetical protein
MRREWNTYRIGRDRDWMFCASRLPDGEIGDLIVLSCPELATRVIGSCRLIDRSRSRGSGAAIMLPPLGERSARAHPGAVRACGWAGGAAKRAAIAAAVASASRRDWSISQRAVIVSR